MPKEYINSMDHGRQVDLAGHDRPVIVDEDAIKLGWGRDSAHVGLAVVDMTADADGFAAKHINLDRHGINRLIRTLRKARDQAFGADA